MVGQLKTFSPILWSIKQDVSKSVLHEKFDILCHYDDMNVISGTPPLHLILDRARLVMSFFYGGSTHKNKVDFIKQRLLSISTLQYIHLD